MNELGEERVESLEPALSSEELVTCELEIGLMKSEVVVEKGAVLGDRLRCLCPPEALPTSTILLKVKTLLPGGGVVKSLVGVLSGLLQERSLSFLLAMILDRCMEACSIMTGECGEWGEQEHAVVEVVVIGGVLSAK